MPSILFISTFHPQRTDLGGGGLRTHFLWEALKQVGEVYIVTPGESNERVDTHCATFHPSHGYWGNMLEGRLWRLTGKISNMVINPCLTPLRLEKWFQGICFDVAVGRYFYAFNDVRPWKHGIPTLVDVDDHPMEKLNTTSRQGGVSWQSRVAMRLELAYLLHHIRGGWVVKDNDRKFLSHSKNFDLLPNIPPEIPADYDPNCSERRQALLTVALFSYAPNRNGVDSFLQTIWPDVKKQYPNMEYWLVGGGLPEEFKKKWERIPGVRLWGFVENLNDVYEQCLAVVVPVNEGAGSCIKTIEAMSRGRIALSTSFGARGYEEYAIPLEEQSMNKEEGPILVYNTPSTFLNGLANYVLYEKKRQKYEDNARQIVRERYSFKKFSDIVATTVEHLIFKK